RRRKQKPHSSANVSWSAPSGLVSVSKTESLFGDGTDTTCLGSDEKPGVNRKVKLGCGCFRSIHGDLANSPPVGTTKCGDIGACVSGPVCHVPEFVWQTRRLVWQTRPETNRAMSASNRCASPSRCKESLQHDDSR